MMELLTSYITDVEKVRKILDQLDFYISKVKRIKGLIHFDGYSQLQNVSASEFRSLMKVFFPFFFRWLKIE